ncbi:MAG: DUF2160 domain-containing protein [bacterium]|nr:DUF2160 domain-containing protein [bacterium]
MYWTVPTAVVFVVLGLILAGMTVWELRAPDLARRGWLPILTTRGDRLFLGLVSVAVANLAWTGLTDVSQWGGLAVSVVVFAIVFRWG